MDPVWIVCIILGAALLLSAIWGAKWYYADMKRWNNGKCSKCGTELKLDGFKNGNPVYKCPKCGHEVTVWWSRTIKTF